MDVVAGVVVVFTCCAGVTTVVVDAGEDDAVAAAVIALLPHAAAADDVFAGVTELPAAAVTVELVAAASWISACCSVAAETAPDVA